jgi:hypothetical protein
MKKTLFLLTILFFSFISVTHAQLTNSRWMGTLIMEKTVNVIWNFEKDTLKVLALADSSMIETMTYKTEPGYLFIARVNGISTCENSTIGKYKFDIRDEKLYLTAVDDACSDRSDAISSDPMIRMKSPQVN